MSEVSLIKRDSGLNDIKVDKGDLVLGDDLQTAVGLSLFSNKRRTENTFDPAVLNSNQGWWGDTLREIPLGSSIWEHRRSKKVSGTLELVRLAAVDCLEWLEDDGIADSIEIATSWREGLDDLMDLSVIINRPSGAKSTFNYQFAWSDLEGE